MTYAKGVDLRSVVLDSALDLAQKAECTRVFLFLDTTADLEWLAAFSPAISIAITPVLPDRLLAGQNLNLSCCTTAIKAWAGNQSRFSRIKYAFLQAVIDGIISADDRVVCVLGPSGKSHLDTVTVHDLARSWSEEFPFDIRPLLDSGNLHTIMAIVDIALDLGALGREGKAVGTIFVVGDSTEVMVHSHQAVFNPFKGYELSERAITRPEVVESLKELAHLDGAIVISADGVAEAAGRHLDAGGRDTGIAHGLGARHRAAAGITAITNAVSIVVSESTGKVTIFHQGMALATLEPLISRRIV